MDVYLSNRRIGKILSERGLLPPNCRLLEVRLEVDGALVIRYERFVPVSEVRVFAEALLVAANAEQDALEALKFRDDEP